MKMLFVFMATVLSFYSNAQDITSISVQASGLTCSMCSNAINKSLKTIPFIQSVEPNIETSSFEITLKPGQKSNFELIKKKVEDAGFFVSSFVVSLDLRDNSIKLNEPVVLGGNTFQFINAKGELPKGKNKIRILNKGFVSEKEYKKNPLASSGQNLIYFASI